MNVRILLLVLGIQALFTTGDLVARAALRTHGFVWTTFLQGWFIYYLVARILASTGQLYILASVELGRTAALFAAASVVVANILGPLLLGDILSTRAYIGMTLAVGALLLLTTAPTH